MRNLIVSTLCAILAVLGLGTGVLLFLYATGWYRFGAVVMVLYALFFAFKAFTVARGGLRSGGEPQ